MSEFKSGWLASTDVDDKSGTAGFFINGENVHIKLETFSDYMLIHRLINEAEKKGCMDATTNICGQLQNYIDSVEKWE